MSPPPPRHAPRIRAMFDRVASGYDLMNSVLSFGVHHRWRRRAAALCDLPAGARVLDLGTGTGDLAAEFLRRDARVVGVDFSEPMLRLARRKLGVQAHWVLGDALRLPFRAGQFDCTCMGFSCRNVESLDALFREMARVTRPGGVVMALDFSLPRRPLLRALYRLYLGVLVPVVGWVVDRRAYRYLRDSILAFPPADQVVARLTAQGARDARAVPLTGGLVTVYLGRSTGPPRPTGAV